MKRLLLPVLATLALSLAGRTEPKPSDTPIGFASVNAWGQDGTTGGAGGTTVTATTAAQFIDYISRPGPLVIEVRGTITLPIDNLVNGTPAHGMHLVSSHKTIIGVGDTPTIKAGGLGMGLLPFINTLSSPPPDATHNIIIRNLTFDGTGGNKEHTDGINIFMFTHHVWVDHCTFRNAQDGACDIKRGSSYVTISYNLFDGINKTSLLGHADHAPGSPGEAQDTGRLKTTYHHNWFKSCVQRQPRVRYAEAHLFNNYWTDPKNVAIGVGVNSRTWSENNVKERGRAFLKFRGAGGALKDIGSIGGTDAHPELITWNPASYYAYTLDPVADVPSLVTQNAGAGHGPFSNAR